MQMKSGKLLVKESIGIKQLSKCFFKDFDIYSVVGKQIFLSEGFPHDRTDDQFDIL